jgi:hypothetical protein
MRAGTSARDSPENLANHFLVLLGAKRSAQRASSGNMARDYALVRATSMARARIPLPAPLRPRAALLRACGGVL